MLLSSEYNQQQNGDDYACNYPKTSIWWWKDGDDNTSNNKVGKLLQIGFLSQDYIKLISTSFNLGFFLFAVGKQR